MTPLAPVITSAGLAAVMAASNTGLQAFISHVAIGDGGSSAGVGYTPSANQSVLVRERVRVPVAGGERVAPNEIMVQALVDTGASFWMREAAFILSTGEVLAIWSHPTIPLGYKTDGVPLAVAYSLALSALPAESVNIILTGPGVNLTMAEPFATLAAALIRTQTHIVQADVDRLSAVISNIRR